MLSCFSHVWLFVIIWAIACQAPLSLGFFRHEYWSGLPCPPLGNLPDPGTEPASLVFPALAGEFFTTSATREAHIYTVYIIYLYAILFLWLHYFILSIYLDKMSEILPFVTMWMDNVIPLMWNLKRKTNEPKKENRNRLIDIDLQNELVVARGEWGWGTDRTGEGD